MGPYFLLPVIIVGQDNRGGGVDVIECTNESYFCCYLTVCIGIHTEYTVCAVVGVHNKTQSLFT